MPYITDYDVPRPSLTLLSLTLVQKVRIRRNRILLKRYVHGTALEEAASILPSLHRHHNIDRISATGAAANQAACGGALLRYSRLWQ